MKDRDGSQPQMESQWRLKWEIPIEAIGCNSGHCGICVLSIISIYIQIYKLKYMYMSDMSGLLSLPSLFFQASYTCIHTYSLAGPRLIGGSAKQIYTRASYRAYYAHVTVAHVRLQSPRTYARTRTACHVRVYVSYSGYGPYIPLEQV